MHFPAVAGVIVECEVQHTAVIPKRDRAGSPAKPAGKAFMASMLKQVFQQRFALLLRHVLETDRKRAIDEQRFATCLGGGCERRDARFPAKPCR